MTQLEISSAGSAARISTVGSALVTLVLNGKTVMPKPAADRHPYHGVMLAPWPNRIAGGNYSFESEEYHSEVNEPFGNALHGLLFDYEAEAVSHTPNRLTLVSILDPSPGYPFSLNVEISFHISEQGLSVETKATNTGNRRCPVGLGTHPFFVFDEESTLEVRAQLGAVHGPDMIPIRELPARELGFGTGIKTAIERRPLDVQFSKLEQTCAQLVTKEWSMDLWQRGADWLMVYTTEEFNWADGAVRAVAIEPQSCPADAFNTKEGLKILEPGESFSYEWGAKLSN